MPCGLPVVERDDWASQRCEEYRNENTDLYINLNGKGKQPKHNSDRPQQACSVYCQMAMIDYWYSPQPQVSANATVYFPDGTWCYTDPDDNEVCHLHAVFY